jgi:hypothetical protein
MNRYRSCTIELSQVPLPVTGITMKKLTPWRISFVIALMNDVVSNHRCRMICYNSSYVFRRLSNKSATLQLLQPLVVDSTQHYIGLTISPLCFYNLIRCYDLGDLAKPMTGWFPVRSLTLLASGLSLALHLLSSHLHDSVRFCISSELRAGDDSKYSTTSLRPSLASPVGLSLAGLTTRFCGSIRDCW